MIDEQGVLTCIDTKGKELLESIKIKGFEDATDSDWNDVRSLNIHLLKDLQKQKEQS